MARTKTKGLPFGLTYREFEVMEEVIRLGSIKAVAASECCNEKTLRNQISVAVKKIGARSTLQAAVMFDRARRESVQVRDVKAANSVFALAAGAR